MLMEVNKEQKQGRLQIRIGAAGKKGSYSTLNIMESTIDSVVGEMSKDQAFEELWGIEEREREREKREREREWR